MSRVVDRVIVVKPNEWSLNAIIHPIRKDYCIYETLDEMSLVLSSSLGDFTPFIVLS